MAQFEEEYGPSLDSHVERVASMLAMQCLVRGCDPCDYAILVPAEKELAARVTSRAKKLLDVGMAAATPVPLSPRQQEILHAVLRNSANKEIAAQLEITEETVKGRVKSILAKLRANDRTHAATIGIKRGIIEP